MPTDEISHVEIYTDGGCDPNPGPGGWGAVLVSGIYTKELNGAEADTTNNRMELTAAISALRMLKRACEVELYTDSQYLRRGITEWLEGWRASGWRKANGKPVENVDLWQELASEAERHQVSWHWLKGHRGHPLNERADQLASEARRRLLGGPLQAVEVEGEDADTAEAALPEVAIYARGCALGAPGPGGYAAILVGPGGQTQAISGKWPLATSNTMELWAVIAGLRALKRRSRVTAHTTSKYVFMGATRWLAAWEQHNWLTKEGEPVKNKEIWLELSYLMGDHDLTWKAISGRDREPANQQAAQLARREAENVKQGQ